MYYIRIYTYIYIYYNLIFKFLIRVKAKVTTKCEVFFQYLNILFTSIYKILFSKKYI
jgi:hypothetical protein